MSFFAVSGVLPPDDAVAAPCPVQPPAPGDDPAADDGDARRPAADPAPRRHRRQRLDVPRDHRHGDDGAQGDQASLPDGQHDDDTPRQSFPEVRPPPLHDQCQSPDENQAAIRPERRAVGVFAGEGVGSEIGCELHGHSGVACEFTGPKRRRKFGRQRQAVDVKRTHDTRREGRQRQPDRDDV